MTKTAQEGEVVDDGIGQGRMWWRAWRPILWRIAISWMAKWLACIAWLCGSWQFGSYQRSAPPGITDRQPFTTEIKCRKGKEPAHGPDAVVECILMSRQVPVAVNDTLPAQVADMVVDCISAGAGVGE